MTNSTITRRQALRLALVGSVALASTGIALSGPLGSTIFAQQSTLSVVLLGVRAGLVPTTSDVPEVADTEGDSAGNPTTGSLAIPVLLQSFNLITGQLQTVPTPQVLPDGTPILRSNEALTGITSLVNGTIVLSIDPVSGAENEAAPPRLTLLGTQPVALSVSGLKKNERLRDVVGTTDGRLLGLVMKENGTPPVVLVDIDLGTGAMSVVKKIRLAQDRRFRTLTQCPDGTLYTTAVENGGDTILVRLDFGQQKPIDVAPLTIGGRALTNGLQSLMCTGGSSAQLVALGAPRYVIPNAAYTIDAGSGVMTKLQDVNVARATLFRV